MKISIQCYTLRDEFSKDVDATFSRLAEMGFRYVELAGLYGQKPEEIRAVLDKNGLKASGSHCGLDRLEKDFDGLVAECKTLGVKDVIVPWVGEDRYQGGWGNFAKSLTPHVEKLEKAGFRFSYHNHAFEFKFEGDRPGMDHFYENADSRVHAQLDLYWCYRGGQDVAAYIRKLKGRLLTTHLKDGTGVDSPHVPAGQGVMKWDDILAASEFAKVEYGVIEFDEFAGKPFESVEASLKFFRDKGYRD